MNLDVRQAAAMLNISETALYRWVDDHAIPFSMIHQRPAFHRLELLDWAIEQGLDVADPGDRDQRMSRALARGGARAGETLAALVAELPLDAAGQAIVLARAGALFSRRGAIAIPRARSPIICAGEPAVLYLRWLGGPSGDESVFAIVAPTIEQHLRLVARVARAVRDPAFAAVLAARGAVLAEAERWERAFESVAS